MKAKLALVIALLTAAGVGLGGLAWWITGPSRMTVHGYIALAITLVLGGFLAGGLMWLAFYSDRHGYDQPPEEP